MRTRRTTSALLGALSLFGGACAHEDPPDLGTMQVEELVRDLVSGEPFWDEATTHADLPAQVGVVGPAIHHSLDGAGTPALILAPPGEASFTVPEDVGEDCRLLGRAGVDVAVVRFLSEATPTYGFDFEVVRNGETVWSTRVDVRHGVVPPGSEWVDVGGPLGLVVEAGDRITLRTFARDSSGERFEPPIPVLTGFGRLRLAHTRAIARRPSSPKAPNVVLVVMDTLRADRLSTYGYPRKTSPNLDRLAERGTTFDQAYATSSWTWPSTASILTGQLPAEHGVVDRSACYLAPASRTLAEALQEAGFTTAAWSGNPLIAPTRNFDQGFEAFGHELEAFRKTGEFFPEVVEWLEANAGRRFFLYLQLTEPHAPYEALPEARAELAAQVPADYSLDRYGEHNLRLLKGEGRSPNGSPNPDAVVPPLEQKWYSDLYDACVRSGDVWLGRLLDTLQRLGLEDETIVCFTNDHGEELFERGLINHGQSLHPELVRAPLVLAGPGVAAGRRVETPVSNRHVAPTLAALAGVRFDGAVDGFDLLAERESDERPILLSTRNGWWNGHRGAEIHALRRGDSILHWCPGGASWGGEAGAGDDELRLYDLSSDPDEIRDLSGDEAERAAELRALLERNLSELAERRTAPTFHAGETTLDLLRRVGYLGDD